MDGYTGLHIRDGYRLGDVFGLYTVAVLDAETYHAADATRYIPLAGGSNARADPTANCGGGSRGIRAPLNPPCRFRACGRHGGGAAGLPVLPKETSFMTRGVR